MQSLFDIVHQVWITFNPLMPGDNKKVTYLNKPAAESLFTYVWLFCYH